MSTELYDLKLSGFHPSFLEKNQIHSAIMRVYEESPSDSYVSLFLDKKGSITHGLLKVASCRGLFSASNSSENLAALLQNMSTDILEKIKKWKETRFIEYVG